MLVGRRTSGASIFSNPKQDGEKSVKDDPRVNAFEFQKNDRDPKGEVCPFASHIRRTNPRDDLDKDGVQPRRLLRRGIPYGKPSSSMFTKPSGDTVDRGLLFIAYQTSIENQFEHIQKVANNPWFKEGNPGYDPIIGQNNSGIPRTFSLTTGGKTQSVSLPMTGWVIPTGGGYFFAPSIKVLKRFVNAR
jgi:Dyp-type peroxidase family